MKIDRNSPTWKDRESTRLETLEDFDILDAPKDEFLNNVTELASRICKTPLSSISLLKE